MMNTSREQISDKELVQLFVNSNKRSGFSELFNRYIKKVENKCYSLLKDRQLSAEFANDIMSKAFEKLPSFKGTSSFSTWLYTITYNYCIDYLRSKKKMHYPEWNREHQIPEIIEENHEEIAEISYQQLLVILELLHPEEKAMILMKYRDDLPMKQVAIALRVSESAAKMRLKRAKARVVYMYKEKFANPE
jgi:RNA polymerase sigma factor (sigma-70 family)